MVNVARLPGPYWLFASRAITSGLTVPAASLPVKSGPPGGLFCRTELQQLAPVAGDTPIPRTDGSHGPMSGIVVVGGSGGLPNAALSGILMRGEVPLSSTEPAWKSKSKLYRQPVRG